MPICTQNCFLTWWVNLHTKLFFACKQNVCTPVCIIIIFYTKMCCVLFVYQAWCVFVHMFIPIKNRDESKSGFTGTNLVLKFLCSPTPDSKFYCQFWSDFCMMAVLAFAWITTALMQWHDFVAIMCLLRLACLTACQLITFTTSTITVFVSDCELICQTTLSGQITNPPILSPMASSKAIQELLVAPSSATRNCPDSHLDSP